MLRIVPCGRDVTDVLRQTLAVLSIIAMVATTHGLLAGESAQPKPVSHTVRLLNGWTVRVDDRLLAAPDDEFGGRATRMLAARLADIAMVVSADRLAKLRSYTIVLDLTNGDLHSMQYHPSAGWLAAHGYSRDLAHCVHIPDAKRFVRSRQVNEQPWAVLHELAHAYHDQELGFNEPRITRAYQQFKKSGHGEAALLYNGKRVRHYALTNQKEFFAEMTEAYIGNNDFFPFNGAELLTAEPEVFRLMRDVWGPISRTK